MDSLSFVVLGYQFGCKTNKPFCPDFQSNSLAAEGSCVGLLLIQHLGEQQNWLIDWLIYFIDLIVENFTFLWLIDKTTVYSRGWFRSTKHWVMGPSHFRRTTLLTKWYKCFRGLTKWLKIGCLWAEAILFPPNWCDRTIK